MTIISHKHKFIFLKTSKTAGTSVEMSLSRFCGEDDIITPFAGKTEEEFIKKLGVVPRNYALPLKLTEYKFKDFLRLIIKREKPSPEVLFYRHMPARKVKAKIGSEKWNEYFKFCFVRNPWDRAISNYLWLESQGIVATLDESLKEGKGLAFNPYIYTIDKQIAVDYVGKYETLIEDLIIICKRLDIPFDNWLPNVKGNIRKEKKQHYSEILTPEQASLIQKKCAREIEWFGYKF